MNLMPFRTVSSIWYLVSGIKKAKYKIQNTKYRKPKGFTLIELLVVMSIIAILIAAASASFMNAQQKGRDGRRKSDLKSVQQALELYFQNNGVYPSDDGSGNIQCPFYPGAYQALWGTKFYCKNSLESEIVYMQKLPKDPGPDGYYYQLTNADRFSYTLSAKLENTNDPDLTGLLCTAYAGPPARNYCVINP